MLRFEIETGLMEGKLQAKDLPDIWNDRMQAYLGVTPPDDSNGVLQDVHWSGGMIGYFPTYALGNLISAQWWEKMIADHPNIPDEIAAGNFTTVLVWLRENVHRYASRYDRKIWSKDYGFQLLSEPYMRYWKKKYSLIYRL
jgi:carboxypeptidase Taq